MRATQPHTLTVHTRGVSEDVSFLQSTDRQRINRFQSLVFLTRALIDSICSLILRLKGHVQALEGHNVEG